MNNKLLSTLLVAAFLFALFPAVSAINTGTGTGIDIETEDFEPRVFQCDSRVVYDDATEPGRVSDDGQPLLERINNYAFEGEQIKWEVIVWDKNGIEKIEDVFATIGSSQGAGNDIEVNCIFNQEVHYVPDHCNARILEEEVGTEENPFQDNTAAHYTCILTVETPESMYGEHWITVEAVDLDGLSGTMDENEFWFLNPVIALALDGSLEFENVRPGTSSYSETLLIGNDADQGSGVMLDMFISGTDFFDSASSGAKCPVSNTLVLGNGDSRCDASDPFCYFVTNGAYSSQIDPRSDVEGYVGIDYGIGFNDPNPFYDRYEILQAQKIGPYYTANILAPGAEMALTFRLNLPEPCNGDFDTGDIFFWGEAI